MRHKMQRERTSLHSLRALENFAAALEESALGGTAAAATTVRTTGKLGCAAITTPDHEVAVPAIASEHIREPAVRPVHCPCECTCGSGLPARV